MKIIFIIGLSFICSFSVFYFIMDWYAVNYDPFYQWIFKYDKQIISEPKKIFLIGSSHLGVLNSTYINEHVVSKEKEYKIYNLAIGGDTPTKRLSQLDKIISLKPDLVVYGVSFRDFQKTNLDQQSFQTGINTQKNILPDVHAILEKNLLSVYTNEFISKIPESPRTRTVTLFQYLIKNEPLKYTTDINSNTPLVPYGSSSISNQTVLKQKLTEKPLAPFPGIDTIDKDNEANALKLIINKFQTNNIKFVLFTTPYNELYLNIIPESQQVLFNSTITDIQKSTNTKLYLLTYKYSDLDVWGDYTHIANNKTVSIFNDDITQIILNEIEQ